MPKITQKQLEEQLKMLKTIKPRKEWASLLLSEITAPARAGGEKQAIPQSADFSSWRSTVSAILFPKMAYGLAAFLFIMVGVLSFAQHTVPGDLLFPVRKLTEQSQASLHGSTSVAQNLTTFNNRINDLTQIAKEGKKANIPSVVTEIKENASELKKALQANAISSAEVKELASTLRVLADVQGTDVGEDSEVKDLYQTVVETQIHDLQKATLTAEQKASLAEAEELYAAGKYSQALEVLLLITI